jgi:hypothetical protein
MEQHRISNTDSQITMYLPRQLIRRRTVHPESPHRFSRSRLQHRNLLVQQEVEANRLNSTLVAMQLPAHQDCTVILVRHRLQDSQVMQLQCQALFPSFPLLALRTASKTRLQTTTHCLFMTLGLLKQQHQWQIDPVVGAAVPAKRRLL